LLDGLLNPIRALVDVTTQQMKNSQTARGP
jgi:hypothetical protein